MMLDQFLRMKIDRSIYTLLTVFLLSQTASADVDPIQLQIGDSGPSSVSDTWDVELLNDANWFVFSLDSTTDVDIDINRTAAPPDLASSLYSGDVRGVDFGTDTTSTGWLSDIGGLTNISNEDDTEDDPFGGPFGDPRHTLTLEAGTYSFWVATLNEGGSFTVTSNVGLTTIDPGEFVDNTDLTNAFPCLTLIADIPDIPGSTVTNSSPPGEPTQFIMAFADGGLDGTWTNDPGFPRFFEVSFAAPTNVVCLDMRDANFLGDPSTGVIEAYDSSGTLIDSVTVELESDFEYQSVCLTRSVADIASIRAYGTGTDFDAGANISLGSYNDFSTDVDPGEFVDNTDLTNAFPCLTLIADIPDIPGSTVTNSSPPGEPTQFIMAFAGGGLDGIWTDDPGFPRFFEVDFSATTNCVCLNMRDANFLPGDPSTGVIEAYDSSGTLIDSVTVELESVFEYQTVCLTRAFADIASIRAYGSGADFDAGANLTLLTYNKIVFGDVNCDGVVNLLDVAPFIEVISEGGFDPKADINADGQVNLLDVAPFIEILSGG